MFDLSIRSALVYDGTGAPPVRADVAVKDGRIAAVGQNLGPSRESLDADGLALAPGIIDTHTHYDAQITWDPYVSPSPALGVTTAVIGNCGFTIAPCRPADRDLVMRNLTHVEGMSLDALRAGIRWQFESFPDYLDQLATAGVGPNVAAFVGHSSVRTYVMGPDATQRAATRAEIDAMRNIVRGALSAGAVGFSSTTSYQHNGEAGIPMPSRLADESELRALVGTLGEFGRGMFMLTKSPDTAIPFLESLAAETGRPVLIAALLHNSALPDSVFEDVDQIAAARSRGRALSGAVSCCPLVFEFSMHEPYPFEGLETWRPAMVAPHGALAGVLSDPEFRAAVKAEIARPARRLFMGEWEKIRVHRVASGAHAACEGRTIADLAAETGRHPLDFMLDLSIEESLDTVFTAALQNSDEDAVQRLLLDRSTIVSLSDAGAHLSFLCDAGFGLHLFGHWVRQRGAMTLEEAVRKVTSVPAEVFGLIDRGRIAPGLWADLLLFDPATVDRGPAVRRHDMPAGASRLVTDAIGVHGVWVNGRRIVDERGPMAVERPPGQVLREFRA